MPLTEVLQPGLRQRIDPTLRCMLRREPVRANAALALELTKHAIDGTGLTLEGKTVAQQFDNLVTVEIAAFENDEQPRGQVVLRRTARRETESTVGAAARRFTAIAVAAVSAVHASSVGAGIPA